MAQNKQKEFDFSRSEFEDLRKRVYALTGIALKDNKFDMVYSRLARRLRELSLTKFKEYVAVLEGENGKSELVNFVNALTTNLTHFFREKHHFQHLRTEVIKPKVIAARSGKAPKTLRIWSAGCSTGQEAYSIAMTVAASISASDRFDVKILATDIDTNVLAKARSAVYGADTAKGIPANLYSRFTRPRPAGEFEIDPSLRKMVFFKHLNLMESWPIKGPFDAIFCRNVMIYFDRETQHRLVSRYCKRLMPGNYLYVGHAESLVAEGTVLKGAGRSTFQLPLATPSGVAA